MLLLLALIFEIQNNVSVKKEYLIPFQLNNLENILSVSNIDIHTELMFSGNTYSHIDQAEK